MLVYLKRNKKKMQQPSNLCKLQKGCTRLAARTWVAQWVR